MAKALADAEECVKLDPQWDKGYMRMALALETQERLEEVCGTLAWLHATAAVLYVAAVCFANQPSSCSLLL